MHLYAFMKLSSPSNVKGYALTIFLAASEPSWYELNIGFQALKQAIRKLGASRENGKTACSHQRGELAIILSTICPGSSDPT